MKILITIAVYAIFFVILVLIMDSWFGHKLKYAGSQITSFGGVMVRIITVVFAGLKSAIEFSFDICGKLYNAGKETFGIGTSAVVMAQNFQRNRVEKRSEIMANVKDAWDQIKAGDPQGEKELLILKAKYGEKAVAEALRQVQEYDGQV